MSKRIVVIGSGFGGLAAAVRLAARGHAVTLVEKRDQAGGRAYVYRPLVNREQARRSVISYLVKRFFDDSPELLVVNLLEHDELDRSEIERLKRLIDKSS